MRTRPWKRALLVVPVAPPAGPPRLFLALRHAWASLCGKTSVSLGLPLCSTHTHSHARAQTLPTPRQTPLTCLLHLWAHSHGNTHRTGLWMNALTNRTQWNRKLVCTRVSAREGFRCACECENRGMVSSDEDRSGQVCSTSIYKLYSVCVCARAWMRVCVMKLAIKIHPCLFFWIFSLCIHLFITIAVFLTLHPLPERSCYLHTRTRTDWTADVSRRGVSSLHLVKGCHHLKHIPIFCTFFMLLVLFFSCF